MITDLGFFLIFTEAFLQSMEADAKERAERRKERERDATRLNEIGNDYFKKGDFKEALNYYNQVCMK